MSFLTKNKTKQKQQQQQQQKTKQNKNKQTNKQNTDFIFQTIFDKACAPFWKSFFEWNN